MNNAQPIQNIETKSDEEEISEVDDLVQKISTELRSFKARFEDKEKKSKWGRPYKPKFQNEDRLMKVLEILVGEVTELKSEIKCFVSLQAESSKKILDLENNVKCLLKTTNESGEKTDSLEDGMDKMEIDARESYLVVSGTTVLTEGNLHIGTSA